MADNNDLRLERLHLDDHSDPEDVDLAGYDHGDVARTPAARSGAVNVEEREQIQRAELAGLRQINQVLTAVNATIAKTEQNMETVSEGVNNANKLLDLWIRILSQTEHTQRLLQSESWEGLSKDLADVEEEERHRKEEAQRRVDDARRRAEEREREAAAAEARRAAAEKKPVRGIRKGATSSTRGTAGAAGTAGARGRGGAIPAPSSSRGVPVSRTSGIGRGLGGTRGRGRGVTK